jgi:hypothetical protein
VGTSCQATVTEFQCGGNRGNGKMVVLVAAQQDGQAAAVFYFLGMKTKQGYSKLAIDVVCYCYFWDQIGKIILRSITVLYTLRVCRIGHGVAVYGADFELVILF